MFVSGIAMAFIYFFNYYVQEFINICLQELNICNVNLIKYI